MKNSNSVLSFLAIITSVAILFSACKKLNESTELGGGLIPPVDNINTFETYLDVITDNKLFADTTKVYFNDYLALGHITSDPEFGTTHANAYFNIGSPYFNADSNTYYPFINKDSVTIDSVILSLSYTGFYGDTNSLQTVRVFEIAQNPGFSDTTLYKYDTTFVTTGGQLGSKTFQVKALKDSILHIRKKDTLKMADVIRIPLQNSFGVRLASYDNTNTSNGGFRNDSIFKSLFRGFAIMADNSGNALTYISPSDQTKTKLTVYFRVTKNGVIDTTSTDFFHQTHGQANVVTRPPSSSPWRSYLNNGLPSDDKIYLQSVPGSYASLTIPALDTFKNAVIHRAELVLHPLPSAQEGTFVQPLGLFLDRVNTAGDTAFTFDRDMDVQPSGLDYTYNFALFGGGLKSDSTYRFNISKYVQDIITLKFPNQTLRLFAPVRAFVYSKGFARISQMYISNQPAYGRVVLGGGNYAVTGKRLRLRVIYSKL